METENKSPSDWGIRPLSDISAIRVSNVDKKSRVGEAHVRLCNYMDVYRHDDLYDNHDYMPATASPRDIASFNLKVGDVLITKDSETPDDIGVPSVIREAGDDLVCGYHLALIRPDPDLVDGVFLSRQLNVHRIKNYFAGRATGSTRYGLRTGDIESTTIWLPPLPEQRAIAYTLTSLDNLIADSEAVIAKLEDIKKGMMHDLLTRGLDANGELRDPVRNPELFKQCRTYFMPLDWRVTTVGQHLDGIDAGNSPSLENKPAKPGEWGVLKVSAVKPDGFVSSENKVIDDQRLIIESHEVKEGDFLITRANTPELVGLTCYVLNPQPQLLLCDKTLRLRFSKTANPEFMLYLTQMPYIRKQIEVTATGSSGSMKNISQKAIRNIEILLPPEGEQVRIVRNLNSLDSQIQHIKSERASLNDIKSGLMDNVITGRVRLPSTLIDRFATDV